MSDAPKRLATISTLPVWKKDSTPAEWLQELAACALANPEKWGRIVVVFEKVDGTGSIETRSLSYNCETNTLKLGTLACAQLEVFDEMKGRR